MTNDLLRRVWEHKQREADGFTKRYGVKRLVFFEVLSTAEAAITREKQLKNWQRAWKIALIEQQNSHWQDLYPALAGH